MSGWYYVCHANVPMFDSAVLLNVIIITFSGYPRFQSLPTKRAPSGEAEITTVAILFKKTGKALNQLYLELYVLTLVYLLMFLKYDVYRLFIT